MIKKHTGLAIWLPRVLAVLLLLTLVSSAMVSGRFARYSAQAAASDSARVARFIFDVADTHTQNQYLDISGIQKPGDSTTYYFTVTNKSNAFVSEVAQSYVLSLDLVGSLPLVCSLTGEDSISLSSSGSGTGATHTMAAGVEQNKTYALTVSWPSNQKNHTLSTGISYLCLSVFAQQID